MTKIYKRIAEINELRDNWDGYGAATISPRIIDTILQFLQVLPAKYAMKLDEDSLTPTPYGTLVVNWEVDRDIISLEIGEESAAYFSEIKAYYISEDYIYNIGVEVPTSILNLLEKLYGRL